MAAFFERFLKWLRKELTRPEEKRESIVPGRRIYRAEEFEKNSEHQILWFEKAAREQEEQRKREREEKLREHRLAEERIRTEKERCAQLLSNIDGKSLDEQQRSAVVDDAQRILVVAGAGSGKTLTIAGKVKYLCQERGIDPEQILLISFTRKAAEEMTERINGRLGIPVQATTFHKLGLDIISRKNGKRPDVAENVTDFITEYFEKNIADNQEEIESLLTFFAYYLHIPADYEKAGSLGAVYNRERMEDLETLLSKYTEGQIIEKEDEKRQEIKQTLQGEFVKSLEEVSIANFLFLNGIQYEYERLYPYESTDSMRKSYRPDFYLPEYDIYIEHFGIDKYGQTPWLSPVEGKKYRIDMQWKIDFHKENGTELICSYSYYTRENRLLSELKTKLLSKGVELKPRDFAEVFQTIYVRKGDKYFKNFIDLCSTFIVLFKSNDYALDDLQLLAHRKFKKHDTFQQERAKLFLQIIRPIIREYERWLTEHKMIDFSDMINLSTHIVEEHGSMTQYQWVIVDEFQDISVARAKLVKAILEATGAKLMAVGDDWQSIYRFAGSDIKLMTDFEAHFGKPSLHKLERTYRNSQELIDVAGGFIQRNPSQIRKNLTSDKRIQYPITFLFYKDAPFLMLEKAMEKIIQDYGENASIMLLGRTHYDFEIIKQSKLFEIRQEDSIVYRKHPNVPVRFLTIHKAKGLEADNVILLNFRTAILGFPSLVFDDPVLSLVLTEMETYPFAEERRLAYVAMTRTKNRVFILADQKRKSIFYEDFEKEPLVFSLIKKDAETERKVSCPRCKTGFLQMRLNEKNNRRFVGCENYPLCDYTYHDPEVLTEPKICMVCGGFMVKRQKNNRSMPFYGCSNYPYCTNTEPIADEEL